MPIFDTIQPVIEQHIATPSQKFSGSDKTIMKLLGDKDDGSRNTWGKIMPFTPFGGAATIGGNFMANQIAKDDSPELQAAIHQSNQQKAMAALSMLQMGAGVGLSAMGMPQAGVPMITSGVGQAVKTFEDGGILPSGSHKSGNDLALVHSKTGEDTDIRLEGGELLFSKENTEALKNALMGNDKKTLFAIVQKQIHEGHNKSSEKEYGDGTSWDGIPYANADTYNPYAFGSFFGQPQAVSYGDPNTWGTWNSYPTPTPQAATPQVDASNPYAFGSFFGQPQGQTYGVNAPNKSPNPYVFKGQPKQPSTTEWGNYLQYAPALAQMGIGLAGASKSLPQGFTIPQEWNDYFAQSKQQSTQGFTPEEKIMYQRDILGNYNLGLNKLVNYSGGNSAAVLAGLNQIGQGKNDAELKLAAMNKQQQRTNMGNYADALNKDIAMKQLIQDRILEMAMKNRAAASSLANTGLSNMEGTYNYNQNYGQGSPYYNAMLEMIKRGQNQNK